VFTGLVEEIGVLKVIGKGAKSAQLTINADKVLHEIKLGDSISTNGVCLTVVAFTNNSFTVDVMPETMRRSNLKDLKPGSKINLERALRLGDRLGGHIVSGHIDGTGLVRTIEAEDNATWVTIEAGAAIMKYVIEKGSIAIDGTSLTVARVGKEDFKVSIIPLTRDETTLLSKKIGEEVNLECDMVGKYIERLTMFNKDNNKNGEINLDFLKENGFV
jgi:riboflavin synthase